MTPAEQSETNQTKPNTHTHHTKHTVQNDPAINYVLVKGEKRKKKAYNNYGKPVVSFVVSIIEHKAIAITQEIRFDVL